MALGSSERGASLVRRSQARLAGRGEWQRTGNGHARDGLRGDVQEHCRAFNVQICTFSVRRPWTMAADAAPIAVAAVTRSVGASAPGVDAVWVGSSVWQSEPRPQSPVSDSGVR